MSEPGDRSASGGPGARPSQISTAGYLIAVSSVLVVIGAFDQVGSLNSVDVRDRLSAAEPDLGSVGLTVDQLIGFLRVGAMVAAACAAATAVLGVFLIRGHKPARLPLTVLAVPLFLLGIVTGDIAGQIVVTLGAAMVAGAVTMLWGQPSRDWFAGRTPSRPVAAARSHPAPEVTTPVDRSTSSPPPYNAPPPQGPPVAGPPPPTPTPTPTPTTQAQAHPGKRPDTLRRPIRRPKQVRWACLSTWYFSGLAIIGIVAGAWPILSDRAGTVADVREQSLGDISQVPDQMIFAMAVAVYGGFALWAVVAMLIAVFVWRGREWARIVLLISAGLSGVLLLGVSLSTLPALPVAIACAIVVRLLLTPGTIAWCRGR